MEQEGGDVEASFKIESLSRFNSASTRPQHVEGYWVNS